MAPKPEGNGATGAKQSRGNEDARGGTRFAGWRLGSQITRIGKIIILSGCESLGDKVDIYPLAAQASAERNAMFHERRAVVGILVAAFVCLAGGSAARAQVIWTWTNQYGSVLSVTAYNQSTGQISGTYTNQAPGSCDVGQPQGMVGWLAHGSGTAISFAVNFLGCSSTTTWTGQLNSASGFQGMWLLSLAAPPVWNGVSAGADTFTFQSGDPAKLRAR
jgi:hypothetical protein